MIRKKMYKNQVKDILERKVGYAKAQRAGKGASSSRSIQKSKGWRL